jgi:hypothetical protein
VNGLSAVLAVAGIVVAVAVGIEVMVLRRRVSAVPPDGNIYDALRGLDEDLTAVVQAIEDLRPRLRSVESRLPGAIRYSAVVTYDAYGNISGNLSRSIALLNERRDGVVITILVGRNESVFFTKMIRGGRGIEQLSPEEQEAVARAIEM